MVALLEAQSPTTRKLGLNHACLAEDIYYIGNVDYGMTPSESVVHVCAMH